MTADTAIITQGVAGKFYIKDLSVTAANIDELTLGKLLMVKDASTGEFYELTIDENGEVTTKVVQIESGNIANGAIVGDNIASGTIVGDNIASGAITADNINAGAVFGDQAIMLNITANMGKFADLFANTLVAEHLKTHLLESDYLKIFVHDTVQIGGRNLVLDSNVDYQSADFEIARYYFGESQPQKGEEITIQIKGQLGEGKTYFNILNSDDHVNLGNLALNEKTGVHSATLVWRTEYQDTDGTTKEVDNDGIVVRVLESSVTGVESSIDWIMVERGNHGSDWSAAPEDATTDIST